MRSIHRPRFQPSETEVSITQTLLLLIFNRWSFACRALSTVSCGYRLKSSWPSWETEARRVTDRSKIVVGDTPGTCCIKAVWRRDRLAYFETPFDRNVNASTTCPAETRGVYIPQETWIRKSPDSACSSTNISQHFWPHER